MDDARKNLRKHNVKISGQSQKTDGEESLRQQTPELDYTISDDDDYDITAESILYDMKCLQEKINKVNTMGVLQIT